MTAPSARFAEWQPRGSRFAGYFNGRVELCDTNIIDPTTHQREFNVSKCHDIAGVTCMEWHPVEVDSHIMALGTQSGTVSLLNWS